MVSGVTPTSAAVRRMLTAVLCLYGFYDLSHPGRGSLLDGVDLAIHETGHLVFGPFGEFLGMAGGTLFQLIVPAVFVAYFVRRQEQHSASVALWWVSQSFGNVATYAADARAQELPLVGGGEHDWFYLLSATGRLEQDLAIARTIRVFGWLTLFGATAWGAWAAGRAPSEDDATE